jgi:hypothetical protein
MRQDATTASRNRNRQATGSGDNSSDNSNDDNDDERQQKRRLWQPPLPQDAMVKVRPCWLLAQGWR